MLSTRTMVYVYKMFSEYDLNAVFGRSKVMQLLGLKSSATSKLLSNLLQLEIIEPVAKQGKGKYKFKSYE